MSIILQLYSFNNFIHFTQNIFNHRNLMGKVYVIMIIYQSVNLMNVINYVLSKKDNFISFLYNLN